MTQEQKRHIRQLRAAGEGYKRISTLLDIPVGTIKSFAAATRRMNRRSRTTVRHRSWKSRLKMRIQYARSAGRRSSAYLAGKSACSARKPVASPTGARRRMPTENLLCAPGAGSRCMGMTGAGSFAATPVTSTAALESSEEADMHGTEQRMGAPMLTHEQLQRELTYRTSMAVLRNLRNAGLVTGREFVRLSQFLAERFSPVWGDLYQNHG